MRGISLRKCFCRGFLFAAMLLTTDVATYGQTIASPSSVAPTVAMLLGSWRLISITVTLPDGSVVAEPHFGPHAQGFLMYEPDGHMCAEIMNPDRPAWKDPKQPTNEEKISALNGFVGYCGTYKLDAAHSTVTHYPTVAWTPPYVGTTQPRPFRIEDRRLIITTAGNDPAVQKTVLVWERAD